MMQEFGQVLLSTKKNPVDLSQQAGPGGAELGGQEGSEGRMSRPAEARAQPMGSRQDCVGGGYSGAGPRLGPSHQGGAKSCNPGEKTKLAFALLQGASRPRCWLLFSGHVPALPELTPLWFRIRLS